MAKLVLYNSYDDTEYRYNNVLSMDILKDYLKIDFTKPKNLNSMSRATIGFRKSTDKWSRVSTLYIKKSQFTTIAWLED